MSILRRVKGHNNDFESLIHIADYIVTKPFTDWDTNVGVVGCRKDNFLKDMVAVKQAYHKNTGRMYDHSVLSITPDIQHIPDDVYMEVGRRIASHRLGYQCVYALHKDTSIRHIHFLFNSVSYKDGKKFSQGPSALNENKTFVNYVLEGYDFDPIKEGMLGCIDNNPYYFDINGYSFLEIDDDSPDDRNILVPPPPDENQYINPDAPIPGVHMFLTGGRRIYNPFNGGYYNMNNSSYPYRAVNPYYQLATPTPRMPVPPQSSTEPALNLVNVNNIYLGSPSDLSAAAGDMNNAFSDTAKAAAEAMAVLMKKGCNANVTITSINNYYPANNGNSKDNVVDIKPNDQDDNSK